MILSWYVAKKGWLKKMYFINKASLVRAFFAGLFNRTWSLMTMPISLVKIKLGMGAKIIFSSVHEPIVNIFASLLGSISNNCPCVSYEHASIAQTEAT